MSGEHLATPSLPEKTSAVSRRLSKFGDGQFTFMRLPDRRWGDATASSIAVRRATSLRVPATAVGTSTQRLVAVRATDVIHTNVDVGPADSSRRRSL